MKKIKWGEGAAGPRFLLRLRFGLLIIFGLLQVNPVSGQLNTQCVQVGQGLPNHDKTYTIGGEKFETKRGEMMRSYVINRLEHKNNKDKFNQHSCPIPIAKNWVTVKPFDYEQDLCSSLIDIRVYAVQQNGKTLRGWLHVEIELTDKAFQNKADNSMFYIYTVVRDEYFNTIGEFVMDENEHCKKASRPGLISPSKYQALPCSATGAREHKTAQALYVAKLEAFKNPTAAKKYISSEPLTRGIHFTWRMSEYWCSRHERFRIDAWVLTQEAYNEMETDITHCKNLTCKLQRKVTDYWLHPKWYGSADIKLNAGGELDCSKLAANFNKNKNETVVFEVASNWIHNYTTRYKVEMDYLNDNLLLSIPGSNGGKYTQGCQVAPKTGVKFGGRCADHRQKNVSTSQFQSCNLDESAPEFAGINIAEVFSDENEDYDVYLNALNKRRQEVCDQLCKIPSTDEDLNEITTKYTYNKVTPKPKIIRHEIDTSDRDVQKRIQVWSGRKAHGVTCLIITLFLLPVSNFLARYYKETFMETRWYGCAPWFWLHIGACFVMLCCYVCGRRSLYSYYVNWGHSTEESATTHRGLGHFAVVIFIALSATGYNRPKFILLRTIFLFIHAFFGFLMYLICIVLVISSRNIPMSPNALACEADNPSVPKGELTATSIITILWLVADLIFHVVMSVLQILGDKKMQIIRRGCGFPFISFLPLEYNRDFWGGKIRKIVLGIYLGIAFLATVIAVADVFEREEEDFLNCTFGEMSCNLKEPGNAFGCHKIQKAYYKSVSKKYDLL